MPLRRYGFAKPRLYERPASDDGKSRTMSVWIHPDDERYVEEVARAHGVTKNRAMSIIINEHRANSNGAPTGKRRVRSRYESDSRGSAR